LSAPDLAFYFISSFAMKGVILAGGTGSRLAPLTHVTNKHLLPVYDRPMIYWSIETLRDAGITDIMIVSGKDHAGHFLNLLKSGRELGVKLTYEVQEEAGGIAQALALAKDFFGSDPVVVMLGDNFLERSVRDPIIEFMNKPEGAKVFLAEVDHPEWYGIAELKDDAVTNIVEKPKRGKEPSKLAVIGLYLYDNTVFDIVKSLKPSARGELEITDVNNAYIKAGTMQHAVLDGWWADAGESFEMYLRSQNLAAMKAKSQVKNKKVSPAVVKKYTEFERTLVK